MSGIMPAATSYSLREHIMLRRTCLKQIAAGSLGMLSLPGMGVPAPKHGIPILLYHRLGSSVADSMLDSRGYAIMPLDQLVQSLQQGITSLPKKTVSLCADDGHRSVFDIMLPLVRQRGIHMTAFIYPSAISNAPYAMTWAQLQALQQSGCFDIQSHSYWHPNFNHEKAKLSAQAYHDFVRWQLSQSRQRLQSELKAPVSMLAWPFGIYNEELAAVAQETGYAAAFTLSPRPVMPGDELFSLPRFLMVDDGGTHQLERILLAGSTAAETALPGKLGTR
jgi:peptidoglycan/xylan/chitin deacetylase (PgdA/CDA1 family)